MFRFGHSFVVFLVLTSIILLMMVVIGRISKRRLPESSQCRTARNYLPSNLRYRYGNVVWQVYDGLVSFWSAQIRPLKLLSSYDSSVSRR